MKLIDFINGYGECKTEPEKKAFVKEHVKRDYMDYLDKMVLADKIVKNSSFTKIDDVEIYAPNTPMRFMLFILTVYSYYSDVEINMNETMADEFDLIEKNHMSSVFMEAVEDVKEFQIVLNMVVDDTDRKETDLVSFLNTKVKAIQDTVNALADAIAPALEDMEAEDDEQLGTEN